MLRAFFQNNDCGSLPSKRGHFFSVQLQDIGVRRRMKCNSSAGQVFRELGTVLVDIYSLWSASRPRQHPQSEYLEII
jgi:hypothetical protein